MIIVLKFNETINNYYCNITISPKTYYWFKNIILKFENPYQPSKYEILDIKQLLIISVNFNSEE